MAVPVWQPGTLYQPGAVVRPASGSAVLAGQLANPDFEDGATGWDTSEDWVIEEQSPTFAGTWRARYDGAVGSSGSLLNDAKIAASPGQTCSFGCRRHCLTNEDDAQLALEIRFYDADEQQLSISRGAAIDAKHFDKGWNYREHSAIAPANTAYFRIGVWANIESDSDPVTMLVDGFVLTSVHQPPTSGLVFTAVQANAGFSGSSEPAWPDTVGQQVADNEVTWEAIAGDRIVWQAHPILVSGSSEPSWPTDGSVPDNTIAWEQDDRRIEDERVPHSKVVALAASKIFAADGDIIPFCATVNPLDWSTREDAGYLPFGLQNYGSEPAAAMGLYRGNLVVFSSKGFQMWQVDEDPAEMALLDSLPVGCTFPKTLQPVSNDLTFLSNEGIRSFGIAQASTNLQAGDFGKAIDPLVKDRLRTVVADKPAETLTVTITIGSNTPFNTNFGFSATYGDVDPDPAEILEGGELAQFSASFSSKEWQLAIDGEHPQDAFISVLVERAPGVFVELRTDDEVNLSYSQIGGQTFWSWVDNDGVWGSGDIAAERQVIFKFTEGEEGSEPLALYVPDLGQYWLIIGAEAFVLTINGEGKGARSWSRYTFPAAIDDWAIMDGELYLRAGDLVWRLDDEALYDDEDEGNGAGGTDTDFEGSVVWPYLDLNSIGITKMLIGFDLVCSGEVSVSFGYDQSNENLATSPYTVDGDTLPGTMIPMPISAPSLQMRLTFSGGQDWEWSAAVLYIDHGGMGA